MAVTCNFRFEIRPESDIVELEAGHHSAMVCTHCLELLTIHRRVHHMNVEKVIEEMASLRSPVTEV